MAQRQLDEIESLEAIYEDRFTLMDDELESELIQKNNEISTFFCSKPSKSHQFRMFFQNFVNNFIVFAIVEIFKHNRTNLNFNFSILCLI